MKVVILAPLPPPAGGIASWAVRMMAASLKNGWTVSIVDEKLIGRSSHGDNNKKNLFVEGKRCIRIWRDLVKELKSEDAKVVHACTAATTTGMLRDYVSCLITHLFKKKFVIHFRCTVPNLMNNKVKRYICKILSQKSDTVIVLNDQSKKYFISNSNSKVELVPNFVEEDAIKYSEKKREYSKEIKRVLYTGGVTEEKGCIEIIQAAKAFPEIEFILVGNIRNEIKELEKPNNVILTGVKDKRYIQNELNQADLFIFFTHMDSEGFANSLVEAMAAGLPCIVTDWSANKEMIEDKGGIILPIHDVQGLVSAIEKLKKDSKLRSKYGNWNIEKVKTNYSQSVVTSKYVDIYESIL